MLGPLVACALLVLSLLFCRRAAAACEPGNLLAHASVASSRSVPSAERLSDDLLAPEGDSPASPAASPMSGMRPYVEWDLGSVTHLVAAAVQADNNDVYRLSISLDGKAYAPLWQIPTAPEPGLRERVDRSLDGTARYVRFEALSGDQVYGAAEVRVYCEVPAVWPPSRTVRDARVPNVTKTRMGQVESLKVVVGLLAFPVLFLLLPRRKPRARNAICAAFIALSGLLWAEFGLLNGNGSSLHYWDGFHYFVGAKYFEENGYFEIYRCAAKALRESGHDAEVDQHRIRDLETNDLQPGEWTRTRAGACRARFSPARWREFKADIVAFQGIFRSGTVPEAFSDHGFNATPFNVVWLRALAHGLPASQATLVALARVDNAALVGIVVLLWWAFGPVAAAVAALMLGLGAFWSYSWMGGCFGRYSWLFCGTAGFALLRRERPFAGAVALTVGALLRLFPFVFVGGIGIWALVHAFRKSRDTASARRFLAGTALAFAVGAALPAVVLGPASYRAFSRVFERHSRTPAANELGLFTILASGVGASTEKLADVRLTEPAEPWTHHQLERREEHRPLWAAAVVVALGVVVLAALTGATAVECGAFAGPLLFCLLPMTSYDYVWLVLLVALAERSTRALPALLAFVLSTQVLSIFGGGDTELEHLIASTACFVLLTSLVPFRALWTVLVAKALPEQPAGPSLPG